MLIDASTNLPVHYYFRPVTFKEIKNYGYNKTNGWDFSWERIIKDKVEIFALITERHPNPPVQGLIALKRHPAEMYIEILNISSAPTNKSAVKGKLNPKQKYVGVGKCLVAFACQFSIEQGFEGYVDLKSRTQTISYYKKIPGIENPGGGQLFTFNEYGAKTLASRYFEGGIKWK